MNRITFVLKMTAAREACIEALRERRQAFEVACAQAQVRNFSIWHMEEYCFGYGESESGDLHCFDAIFAALPKEIALACAPGTMRLMYHDIGIVRADKALIRHRVFATKLKPGCAEEYKRRHDGLIEARGDAVSEGPESNFTIWYGDGHIFGYCERVRSFIDGVEPTEAEKAATIAWETRQLEIMDWLTDDVDWLTGEKHAPVERVL